MNSDEKSALQQNHDRMVAEHDRLKGKIETMVRIYREMGGWAKDNGEDSYPIYFGVVRNLKEILNEN